jgi:hypothetical protein
MDFLNKKTDYSMAKSLLNGLMVLFLSLVSSDLPGQKSTQIIQQSKQETIKLRSGALSDSTFPVTEIFQKKGIIRGQLSELNSNSSICFADISTIDNELVTKSNTRGEFLLFPNEYPITLRISKFGFKEVTIILNNPDDSVLISLTPLEIHKKKFSNKNLLEYGIVLKKAIEKFKKYEGSESPVPVQRKLVYCRITSSVDSTINGLFESYMHMNVNN